MRKLSANFIFPIAGKPLKNGILIIGDSGEILKIVDTNGELYESEKLEFYNGVLVPGFVNTHCHLELSHLKNKITNDLGLTNFIDNIKKQRFAYNEEIHEAAKNADEMMQKEGIVAVGDISNTSKSFPVKSNSKIHYHTFIEVFSFLEKQADEVFQKAHNLYIAYQKNVNSSVSIVPHASYSVSEKLFSNISEFALKNNSLISIHNQECAGENKMISDKTGDLYDYFIKCGFDLSEWKANGKNSINSSIRQLPESVKKIYVHNTFTSKNDLDLVLNQKENIFFSICPNSNIYIENKLPNLPLFMEKNAQITIGTDSLASNNSLSILEELKTINNFFPEISFMNLIKWATQNGALALNLEKSYGSFETGKTPGINLIQNFDFEKMNVSKKSTVKVIV